MGVRSEVDSGAGSGVSWGAGSGVGLEVGSGAGSGVSPGAGSGVGPGGPGRQLGSRLGSWPGSQPRSRLGLHSCLPCEHLHPGLRDRSLQLIGLLPVCCCIDSASHDSCLQQRPPGLRYFEVGGRSEPPRLRLSSWLQLLRSFDGTPRDGEPRIRGRWQSGSCTNQLLAARHGLQVDHHEARGCATGCGSAADSDCVVVSGGSSASPSLRLLSMAPSAARRCVLTVPASALPLCTG